MEWQEKWEIFIVYCMEIINYIFCALFLLVDVIACFCYYYGIGQSSVWSDADKLLKETECKAAGYWVTILFMRCYTHNVFENILMLLIRIMQVRYIFKLYQKMKLYYVFKRLVSELRSSKIKDKLEKAEVLPYLKFTDSLKR